MNVSKEEKHAAIPGEGIEHGRIEFLRFEHGRIGVVDAELRRWDLPRGVFPIRKDEQVACGNGPITTGSKLSRGYGVYQIEVSVIDADPRCGLVWRVGREGTSR